MSERTCLNCDCWTGPTYFVDEKIMRLCTVKKGLQATRRDCPDWRRREGK